MLVTEEGMLTLVKPEQPSNAELLISFTDFGIETEVILVKYVHSAFVQPSSYISFLTFEHP